MILPQLDQSPLFASMNFSLSMAAPANTTGTQTSMAVFQCPSDQLPGRTFLIGDGLGDTIATVSPSSYAACTGSDHADVALGLNNDGSGDGLFFRNSFIRFSSIIDGTSQTIMLLERSWGASEGTWTARRPMG